MSQHVLYVCILAAAVGSGLVAGIFFGFSSFVMRALGRLSAGNGIAAMQSINIVVINPIFMLAFMGTGVICLVLSIGAYSWWIGMQGRGLIAIAGILYVFGCIGVTMRCNVPLNNALAAAQPESPQAAELWTRYLRDWTFWNHVRTLASLIASILFIVVLT